MTVTEYELDDSGIRIRLKSVVCLCITPDRLYHFYRTEQIRKEDARLDIDDMGPNGVAFLGLSSGNLYYVLGPKNILFIPEGCTDLPQEWEVEA